MFRSRRVKRKSTNSSIRDVIRDRNGGVIFSTMKTKYETEEMRAFDQFIRELKALVSNLSKEVGITIKLTSSYPKKHLLEKDVLYTSYTMKIMLLCQ